MEGRDAWSDVIDAVSWAQRRPAKNEGHKGGSTQEWCYFRVRIARNEGAAEGEGGGEGQRMRARCL